MSCNILFQAAGSLLAAGDFNGLFYIFSVSGGSLLSFTNVSNKITNIRWNRKGSQHLLLISGDDGVRQFFDPFCCSVSNDNCFMKLGCRSMAFIGANSFACTEIFTSYIKCSRYPMADEGDLCILLVGRKYLRLSHRKGRDAVLVFQ